MFNFGKAIPGLRQLETLRSLGGTLNPTQGVASRSLKEVHQQVCNPGNLRMFTYVPSQMVDDRPLVVVLHGCGQTAAGYDHGAGWSTLANRYGFALLLPEQQRANNPNGCFNWFEPGDTRRGCGEAASIQAMVERMVTEDGIDPRRVYITGLSAGGAMTSVMLACYPELFAGGAIIAGLPYGAAGNVQQALESMFHSPSRPAREWGDLVRQAAPHHQGPWPRVSVWHGNADKTVIPSNAGEILKQWTEVHGLPTAPSMEAVVDGYPRQVWFDQAGEALIESYSITHMAHGTPLATGTADSECGASGPFLLDVGISSSFHIAKFFELTTARVQPVPSAGEREAAPSVGTPTGVTAAGMPAPVLNGAVLDRVTKSRIPTPPRVDIGAVIARALEAAGLTRR